MKRLIARLLGIGLGLATASPVLAEDEGQSLATQLSNPVSSLISVPFQYNYNQGLGTGNGTQNFVNIQPVVPISIGGNWNLISRTILPVVSLDNMSPGAGSVHGFGNTTQSFFFSPKAPTKGGLIWGVGPVLQIPTATNGIGPSQWGAGITGVALMQRHGWTVGMLANQIWSVGGASTYGDTSTMFLQPFLSYSTKKATSFTLNTESTYNWITDEWSVPINLMAGQIVKIGGAPVQFTGGIRYWAESPAGQADDWGARFVVTFLFPKGKG